MRRYSVGHAAAIKDHKIVANLLSHTVLTLLHLDLSSDMEFDFAYAYVRQQYFSAIGAETEMNNYLYGEVEDERDSEREYY